MVPMQCTAVEEGTYYKELKQEFAKVMESGQEAFRSVRKKVNKNCCTQNLHEFIYVPLILQT